MELCRKSTVVCDTLELWSAKWESKLVYELTCSSSRRIFSHKPAKMLKEKILEPEDFQEWTAKIALPSMTLIF